MATGASLIRGRPNPQRSLPAIADLEERVLRDHPLRRLQAVADAALERSSSEFKPHVRLGGPASAPPEQLYGKHLPSDGSSPMCEGLNEPNRKLLFGNTAGSGIARLW